jgi:hypothetical protein
VAVLSEVHEMVVVVHSHLEDFIVQVVQVEVQERVRLEVQVVKVRLEVAEVEVVLV